LRLENASGVIGRKPKEEPSYATEAFSTQAP
jgi:hypothetical protein